MVSHVVFTTYVLRAPPISFYLTWTQKIDRLQPPHILLKIYVAVAVAVAVAATSSSSLTSRLVTSPDVCSPLLYNKIKIRIAVSTATGLQDGWSGVRVPGRAKSSTPALGLTEPLTQRCFRRCENCGGGGEPAHWPPLSAEINNACSPCRTDGVEDAELHTQQLKLLWRTNWTVLDK